MWYQGGRESGDLLQLRFGMNGVITAASTYTQQGFIKQCALSGGAPSLSFISQMGWNSQ